MLETLLTFLFQLVSFLFLIGILVFVHELGHFWMARRCKVRVEEFAFGLPPRLWSIKKNHTTYAINAIPFGGYVKMYGQNDFAPISSANAPLNHEHFEAKSWWQKSLILCAGVVMNMLLAVVLLTTGYLIGMQPLIPGSPLFEQALEKQGVAIYEIKKDSIAEKYAIPADTTIQAVNGTPITSSEQFKTVLEEAKTKGITFELKNGNENIIRTIPALSKDQTIGIAYADAIKINPVQLPFDKAIYYGTSDSFTVLVDTFRGLGTLIVQLFSTLEISQDVTGPIGIFRLTSEVSKVGIIPFMQLLALLSISLAAINIIPFPALDGGRLIFVLLEALIGKRFNKLLEGRIHLIGMALLLLFMLTITYKDIVKLF